MFVFFLEFVDGFGGFECELPKKAVEEGKEAVEETRKVATDEE